MTLAVFCNLLFVVLFLNSFEQVLLLQCKDERNQDVDWFVLYKIPKISDSNNNLIKNGAAYLYMHSNNYNNGWTLSDKDIGSKESIPAYTLAPFYDKKQSKDFMWILYNDQPPNKPSIMYNGHTKGAVMVNEHKGFWLIHSVPNFPPEPEHGVQSNRQKKENDVNDAEASKSKVNNLPVGEYNYPSSGKVNGQSFMCISTIGNHFDTIGKQLMYNQILVFKKNLPKDISDKYTVLTDAANEKKIKKEPYNNSVNFYSTGGMEFKSFAKSSKWARDLYDDFVAPELNTDLYAETWLNGRGRLPSECNASSVYNVQLVYLSIAKVEFKSSHDHSKWAVSNDGKNKGSWVCIGDINRADTQFERGGGTVCLNVPEVWKNYRDTVKDVEPCPKSPKNKKGIFEPIKSWFASMFTRRGKQS
ncbi:plancitoxin-1 [Copidosoma floridanum]|uniref:plancitoxin-1 n=1 Tax=Copidosoma floridanum TaxID=29053 RepID=UPI0006C964C6|nr:plancitoxin-1 [Copidosoma floridanum]